MAYLKDYYVNLTESSEGDHEVHEDGCYWLSIASRKTHLGAYDNCRPAVTKAKQYHFSNSNGCKHCSPDCHTG